MHTFTNTNAHTYMHTCMHTVPDAARSRNSVSISGQKRRAGQGVHGSTHTHTHTHIYIYIHTYIHRYLHIHAYIQSQTLQEVETVSASLDKKEEQVKESMEAQANMHSAMLHALPTVSKDELGEMVKQMGVQLDKNEMEMLYKGLQEEVKKMQDDHEQKK
jgi:hypothetical protein